MKPQNSPGSSSISSIYHVTASDVVDSIFKHEFDREFNNKNGNVYGAGVYTTISVKDSRKLLGSYGDAMIELKVIGGFDRFIIFDALLAKKYYGENYRVLDQLKTMLPTKIAIKLYQDCGTNVKSYSKLANKYNIRGAIYNWNGVTKFKSSITDDMTKNNSKITGNVTGYLFFSNVLTNTYSNSIINSQSNRLLYRLQNTENEIKYGKGE